MSVCRALSCLVLLFCATLTGCGSAVEERVIVVQPSNDPLAEPRSVLQRYVEGQPIGSEADGFADMVARVRAVDAERADILEAGFAEVTKASTAQRRKLAEDLLAQLQPRMTLPSDDAETEVSESEEPTDAQ